MGSLIARGRSKDLERVVNSYNCNKLKRTIMLSAEISTELILSIDPHPSFKSQHRCQNPCSGLLCCHRQFILTFNLTAGQVERVGRSKLIQTNLTEPVQTSNFSVTNSLSLVYLMRSSTSGLGLYMFLWTWRYTIFNSNPIIVILLTNKIVHWIYYVKINLSIKQRIVRR